MFNNYHIVFHTSDLSFEAFYVYLKQWIHFLGHHNPEIIPFDIRIRNIRSGYICKIQKSCI